MDIKELVFFHAQPKLRQFCTIDFDSATAEPLEDLVATGDRQCIDNFYGQAIHRLAEAGIGESQFEIKTTTGLSGVGSQIVKELASGRYQTVVMGRSGGSRNYFMGSVAHHVIGKATDCAVWIVPWSDSPALGTRCVSWRWPMWIAGITVSINRGF